jgi:prevent-host-death family protein
MSEVNATAVNIHEAKTHLSRLLARVQQGEEIVIAKAGRPIARLVKIVPKSKRVFGSAAGTIKFTPGWDAPMTDEEYEEFLGG